MGCVNQLTTGDNLGLSETKSFRRYPRKSNRTQRSHGICCGNAVWIWQIWRFRRTVVWTLNEPAKWFSCASWSAPRQQRFATSFIEPSDWDIIASQSDFHMFTRVGSTTNQKTWVRKKLPSWSLACWSHICRGFRHDQLNVLQLICDCSWLVWGTFSQVRSNDFSYLIILIYVYELYIWIYIPLGGQSGWNISYFPFFEEVRDASFRDWDDDPQYFSLEWDRYWNHQQTTNHQI